MIEFLPPRVDAFGPSDVADFVGFDGDDEPHFDDDGPRSRWTTVLAALGMTALLVGGVVAAAPWSDDAATPDTTTPPPTTAPTTTSPATTVSEPELRIPPGTVLEPAGWLPITDTRFEFAGAGSQEPYEPDGRPMMLWVSENAARTEGRWVAIADLGQHDLQLLRRSATPIDVAGERALLIAHPDGVAELVVDPADRSPFTVTSFGLGLDELLAVAAAVRPTSSLPELEADPLAAPGAPLHDLRLVVRSSPEWSPGWPNSAPVLAWSGFTSPETGEWIQVAVAAFTADSLLVDEFLLRTAVDPALLARADRSRLAELTAAGRTVELFTSATDPGLAGAAWFDGDGRTVVAAGSVSMTSLLQFVAVLEPADPDDWIGAILDSQYRMPDSAGPSVIGGDSTMAGDDGFMAQAGDGWFYLGGRDTWVNHAWQPASGPQIIEYRTLDQAFVVITNTWPNKGIRVRIAQASATQELRLVQVGDSPVFAVAARISPSEPYEITWFDLAEQPVVDG